MMEIKITECKSKKEILQFIKAQWLFYKSDKNFVPPLIMDRQKLLDTQKNPFYKHAKIKLMLAYSGDEIVGRIAAITNENHNKTHNDKVGFFGFFESVNDQKVADKLFDSARDFLKASGMDTMRGPVHPSMNDENGLLISGVDEPPVILMCYNPPYYKKLIEDYGFAKAMDTYAYILDSNNYASDKMKRLQGMVRDRYNIKIRSIELKDKAGFKRDVAILKDVYNKAWELNWGHVMMTGEEFDFLANDLKQIADPKFALICEIDGKPAGFALAVPDINQSLIHNKSGGILTGIWHLLTKKSKIDTVRVIVLGLLPEYRRTGADAVMYWEIGQAALNNGIRRGEASWILENNEMMKKGLETTMNAEIYKTYRLFDKKIA